jgi:hypothetical protein
MDATLFKGGRPCTLPFDRPNSDWISGKGKNSKEEKKKTEHQRS